MVSSVRFLFQSRYCHVLPLLSLFLSIFVLANALPSSLRYNFGTQSAPKVAKSKVVYHGAVSASVSDLSVVFIPASFFRSSVSGARLALPLRVSAGVYDVTLGFIVSHPSSCSAGVNVFDISLGGSNSNIKLPSYDIFSAAGNRCGKPVSLTFARARLPSTLLLSTVSGVASISYLSAIRSSAAWDAKCKRPTTNQGLPAHLAHAVAGTYKPVTDWRGVGYVGVFLDGRGSHSHFTHSGKRAAKIVSYTWSLSESGVIISRKQALMHDFPVGTTRVTLHVVDDACNQHAASATVTVTTANKAGSYCYFYGGTTNGKQFPAPWTIFTKKPTHPFAAAPVPLAPVFDFFSIFPPLASRASFSARCVFFLATRAQSSKRTPVTLRTSPGLHARLFQRTALVVDTKTLPARTMSLVPGNTAFELHVFTTTTFKAKKSSVTLLVNRKAPKVTFDETSVMPVLSAVTPSQAALSGGTIVSISGFGFYWPLSVHIGGVRATPEWRGSSPTRLFVKTPKLPAPSPSNSKTSLPLTVRTKPDIVSNKLPIAVSASCDPVSFARAQLHPKPAGVRLVTSVVYGNDGFLYMSSATGRAFMVGFDAVSLRTMSSCGSAPLLDGRYRSEDGALAPRAALGITSDPRDSPPRPYVSLNTLLWPHRIARRTKLRWANGAVVRLVGVSEKRENGMRICLKFDKFIVKNLPVSRRDHGVNALVFTQGGDLLISLGGHTNAGLPSHVMGGTWEAFYSASVLLARLSLGGKFNGEIEYINAERESSATAKPKKSNSFSLFATGTRNVFSMTMMRDGRVLGVDMGANCGQGNVSSSCDEYNPEREKRRGGDDGEIRWTRGRIVVDRTDPDARTCPHGPSRTDKILWLKQGGFYGHPNLQRGRPDQCRWIDPYTNRSPPRNGGFAPPKRYEKPFSMVFSAKTGLIEYGSGLFCGELRGDIILAQYSEQGTWRLRLGGPANNNLPTDEPYQFINGVSGMGVVESVHGDLLLPRYKAPGVLVARAKVRNRKGQELELVNVLPFRHGRNGGSSLYLGGFGFKKGAQVLVGGRQCKLLETTSKGGRELACVVPRFAGGAATKGRQADVTVVVGKQRSTLRRAVLYMAV